MRDLNEQEQKALKQGMLPCGCGNEFFEGPCGGAMMNITCASCGLKLNIIDPSFGFGGVGQVLHEPEGYQVWQPPAPAPVKKLWQRFLSIFRKPT